MKFGIIGTGRIAKRFIKELEHVEGASVSCVYNPHVGSAASFVGQLQDEIVEAVPNAVNGLNKYSIPEPLDDIEKMWDKVDAVYIASPHATHMEYVFKALEKGKHVLCEKPMALKKSKAEKTFAQAKANDLVLMEGLKTAYLPGFIKLCKEAKSGFIGDIVHVRATFTKLVPEDGREYTDKIAAGSFKELGTYGMLGVFSLLGLDYKEVSFKTIRNKDGIDIFTEAQFDYGNAFGEAVAGIGVKSDGSMVISGTKGYILVPAPWWLTKHFEVHFEDSSKVISFDEELEGDGLRYEIREFINRVEGKQIGHWSVDISIALAEVMEKI